MILFIAHYPTSHNEKEGMMQRIHAVDRIFENEKRIYAQISPDNSEDFISKELSIYNVNFNNNIDIKKLRDLILKANLIYVHSIYNGQYILPFYKYKKIITDMHGVVPEEEAYAGRTKVAEYLEKIEKFIVHNSHLIINVSKTMSEHFKNKYPDIKTEMAVLPIIDNYQINIDKRKKITKKKRITVIYSGGTQKWQNTDLMIEAIAKAKDKFKFIIVTKDFNQFREKINRYKLNDIVEIKSMARNEIDEYYYRADFGFILRDDIVINKVACPTKLTEYLAYGIIPIVIQPEIGDFNKSGYSYITLDDFVNGNIPSERKIENLRNNNYRIIDRLIQEFNNSAKRILNINTHSSCNNNSDIYLTVDEIINNYCKAQLYIDTGSGFSEDQSISKEISEKNELLEFNLSNYDNIKSLRFDPLNNLIKINLEEIKILDVNNKLHTDIYYEANSIYKQNSILMFDTLDPQIYIDTSSIPEPIKLFIKLEYICQGNDVSKCISEYRKKEINVLQEIIKNKDTQIDNLTPKYFSQLFINNGSGFTEDLSIIKKISGDEKELVFDLLNYNNIEALRFAPLNNSVKIKLEQINIIDSNNLYNHVIHRHNGLCTQDNTLTFETDAPYIYIDIKDIVNPHKIIIYIEYILMGDATYKDISENKSAIIQTRDREIQTKNQEIQTKNQEIQTKDIVIEKQKYYLEKLTEKENILNNIYNSHGWKLLLTYYKLRDYILPENSVKRKLAKSIFQLPSNLRKRLRDITIQIDHIELNYNSIEISGWALSHSGIDKIEIYIDEKFINNATYRLPRGDVQKEYDFIKNSINSGFYLYAKLDTIYPIESNHTVTINGINTKNKNKEIILSVISRGCLKPEINLDKVELHNNNIEISGWAISDDLIDKVEVYLCNKFIGNSLYGQLRTDVGSNYSYIKNSEKSGFYLASLIENLEEDVPEYNIKVKAITVNGYVNEAIRPVIKTTKPLWAEKSEPHKNELEIQKKTQFKYEPTISIITPTYNTPEKFLIDMIESVLEQTYSNWELCIADGHSNEKYIKEILQSYADKDKRIKIKVLTENKGIAGNSNEALSMATGDFITLLDHDDMLAPFALFEIVKIINEHPDIDFIYSDEDKISEDGKRRFKPHFKPGWSPDTLRSNNYPIHVSVFRKEIIKTTGGFREGFEGSQDYDLILRVTEKTKKIIHIPKVLYHWRINKNSTAGDTGAKLYAYDSAKKALGEHLERTDMNGTVEDGLWTGTYKITYDIPGNPKVSIIIPNKDHCDDLKRCINSIINKSSYKNFEIIIVENNSKEEDTFKYYKELKKKEHIKIIEWNNSFNYAAINNFAVNCSEGEILLFLNNDTEVINTDWLERMIEHVMRKEIGAAGAKLYYPDNKIQHGGVIIRLHGAADHAHRNFHKDAPGYFARLKFIQNLSAVTAACLMMRKDVFREIGGFDERYTVAFNDVDLCLKIREKGYLIIWTPYAELYHYESKTRGMEDTPEKQERARKEVELLKSKWKDIFEKGDPYYNPNLSLDKEDFSLKYD